MCAGPHLELFDDVWVERWRLCIEQSAEPLYPPIANESHVTKQTALCVLDVMRTTRLLPLEIHPLKVLVETSLVAIFDAHLKLTDEFLEESLHSLNPHALKAFPSCFERLPEVAVAWNRAQ